MNSMNRPEPERPVVHLPCSDVSVIHTVDPDNKTRDKEEKCTYKGAKEQEKTFQGFSIVYLPEAGYQGRTKQRNLWILYVFPTRFILRIYGYTATINPIATCAAKPGIFL